MDCHECQQYLIPFLHGTLAPGTMRAMQMHLHRCPTCQRALEETRPCHDAVIPLYLVAHNHDECTTAEREQIDIHLAYCDACRHEAEMLRQTVNELKKHLSQYQLPRIFRTQVMQEWAPHRLGRPLRYHCRGLADMIDRAEAGNTFSFERLVEGFKDIAYLQAYQVVGDFLWASQIATTIFVRGLPVFMETLTQKDFLEWLRERADEIAREGGWQDETIDETVTGLSGYHKSAKLRRHRRCKTFHKRLPEPQQMPFLLYYVQHLPYKEIGKLLDMPRITVLDLISRATLQAQSERLSTSVAVSCEIA